MSPTRLFPTRLTSVAALAGLLVLTATMVSDAAGPWPSVVGGGSTASYKFSFSANEGPSSARGGWGSAGHAKIDGTDGTKMQGPVLCATINLTTQEGWFIFQYDTDPSGNAIKARVYAQDLSQFAAGGDRFGWDTTNATCTQNPVDLTLHPTDTTTPVINTSTVVKGNIVIDNE